MHEPLVQHQAPSTKHQATIRFVFFDAVGKFVSGIADDMSPSGCSFGRRMKTNPKHALSDGTEHSLAVA
jgi:hypothetical protein